MCVLCDKVLGSLEECQRHKSTHEHEIHSTQNIIEPLIQKPQNSPPPENPHQCKICNARFSRLINLKKHMMHHTGEKEHKCPLCAKYDCSRHYFLIYLRSYLGFRTFVTRYRLTEHVNYHKNIRNYSCQVCGKNFVTSSMLKRHMTVHNAFKPYFCLYCHKTFKTTLLCRAHIKNDHKINESQNTVSLCRRCIVN